MGLQLSTTTDFGLTADYYNIGKIAITKGFSNIDVHLFVNHQARSDGSNPIKVLNYYFPDIEFDVAASPFVLIYNKLKTLPEFAGATDC